jgi:hypothetical protein
MTTIKWATGESGTVPTVTVAVDVALVPADPVAVNTYLVVTDGATVAVPLTGRFPLATAGVMLTDVALAVVHVNETDWPCMTWVGAACREAVGEAGDGAGVVAVLPLLPPPQPAKLVAIDNTTARHLECSFTGGSGNRKYFGATYTIHSG